MIEVEPFERIKGLWDTVLESSIQHKFAVFGRDAAENARFYGESSDYMYTPEYVGDADPVGAMIPGGYYQAMKRRMSTNLVFAMVEAFLPFLYAKDPVFTVTPRKPEIPDQLLAWLMTDKIQNQVRQMLSLPQVQSQPQIAQQIQMQGQQALQQAQQQAHNTHDLAIGSPGQQAPPIKEVIAQIRAALMQWVLNATANLGDLKGESRKGLVDGLVKGRGILAAELMHWGPFQIPYNRYIDVDDLFVDPDVKDIKHAKWIAIRRKEPVWKVEMDNGWSLGSLRADFETYTQTAAIDISTTREYDRQTHGKTCDLIEYFEVFSRMGLGSFLRNATTDLHMYLDQFGPNVRVLIHKDQRMPLNLPPWLFYTDGHDDSNPPTTAELIDEIAQRLAWPVETWKRPGDTPWPLAFLDFHRQMKESWPMAHATPSLAYVKGINWLMTYFMGRIHHSHRTLLCVPKSLEEDIKDQILHGSDLELLEIEKTRPGTMEELLKVIQFPDAPAEMWKVYEAMRQIYMEATGANELMMSGQTTHAYRSAAEANVKQQATQSRPADMANTVEEWLSEAGRNVSFAWLCLPHLREVAAIFGEEYTEPSEKYIDGENVPQPAQMGTYTQLWLETVSSEDPSQLSTYFDFDIEAGSAQKKNREQQIAVAQQTLQLLLPLQYQYYRATGDATQINAAIRSWAMSIDHPDPDELMFPDKQQQMQAMQQQAQEQASFNLQHKEAEQQGRHPQQQQEQLPPQLMSLIEATQQRHMQPTQG